MDTLTTTTSTTTPGTGIAPTVGGWIAAQHDLEHPEELPPDAGPPGKATDTNI